MDLTLLYPATAASNVNAALNIVVVPGIGLPSPKDWKTSTGEWLKNVITLHGDNVRIFSYNYEVVKGQPFMQSLLQLSHVLPTLLHKTFPRDLPCGPLLIICQSLGGCIWKQAYANMIEKRHENSKILDHIHGVVFLGTPHFEDAAELDSNIVETIARASDASFSSFSFTLNDNQSIAHISRGFSSFGGAVISTFETAESKYKAPYTKVRSFRSHVIIPRELALFPSNRAVELFGIACSHENLCKVEIDGELYKAILRIIDDVVRQHQTSADLDNVDASSESHTESDSLDDWDAQSLRSHRRRMIVPMIEAGSQERLDRAQLLSPHIDSSKPSSATPSASAGSSSQFSYDIVPSPDPVESENPKLSIPCFSVGSQSRMTPFIGRVDILKAIDECLLPQKDTLSTNDETTHLTENLKTFALCGPGGTGKTELASEYIFSREAEYSVIFWVTADSRNVLLEDFARVAVDLGLQAKTETQDLAEARELVRGWLCNPVKGLEPPLDGSDNEVSWLLVLDNVHDWSVIEDFWPTTGIGSILITSRDPLSRSHVYTTKNGLDLNPFSPTESLEFLNVNPKTTSKGTQASAKAIADWAGGLPLILTAIASTMSAKEWTYKEMLKLLEKSGFEAVSSDKDPQVHSVQDASIASMIGVACLDKHTQSLIRIISYLNPEDIPQRILVNNPKSSEVPDFPRTTAEANSAQLKLRQASLITANDSTKTIRMHRIYQDVVRDNLKSEEQVEALSTALSIVSDAWEYQSLEHRFHTTRYDVCSAIFPHVDRLYQHYEKMFRERKIGPSEQAASLFNDAGWYWFERGLPQESKPFFMLVERVCEELLQANPTDKISEMLRASHNNQGSAANETNKPEESLRHNLKWLSLTKSRRSKDGKKLTDYELGCVYNEVGVAYAMNGMYDMAMEKFQESVETYEALPDYDEKWLGWPLPNIGMVHWVQGKYNEALDALHRMRKIYKAAYGRDDRHSFKTGKVLYGLGNVYLSMGDLDSAMIYHLRCLHQWSETLGPGHHRIGDVSHKIAQISIGKGQFIKAQQYLTQALRIFAGQQYHKHEYIRTIYRQGQLHSANGEVDLADQSFKKAHKQRQSLVHQDTRPWNELLEQDYDDLVIFMSR